MASLWKFRTAHVATCLIGLCLLAWQAQPVAAQESTVKLDLYELNSSTLIYRGLRREIEKNGVVNETTVYTDLKGVEIHKIEVIYRKKNLGLVSYRLRDLVIGKEADLTYRDGKVAIRFLEKSGEDEDTDEVEWTETVAFSSAVVPLIVRGWERLLGGGEVVFDYLVPSRQETVEFRVRMDRRGSLNGVKATFMRMEPDSWIIRALVDPIFFIIEDDPRHRILEYQGRSSIPTKEGDDQDLRLVYRY